ncbi:MAG: aspartate aminotransferase family protein [Spirochaetales bacterium]|nr:aspartate aminotransferase family protein [Spirochaetales bacterium]
MTTFEIEDTYYAPFFNKIKISIERGEGIYVWDEAGKKYTDLTSGWGVTSIGHIHPVIQQALIEQGRKIIQTPNSGLTYSPERAKLLLLLKNILPSGIKSLFFTNSGTESVDAAIKLSRKIKGKATIISAKRGFHGRTSQAFAATSQADNSESTAPVPLNVFVPYNDVTAIKRAITGETAAVLLEPVQGEGGVIVPDDSYLPAVSELCRKKNVYLIIDEVQTGFYRTGPAFACNRPGIKPDFITMAKGIAGGFPFGAIAMSDDVTARIKAGDHGGTFCGNPIGCAVSFAVIRHMIETDIEQNVLNTGRTALRRLNEWKTRYPDRISDVRGKGLLLAIEFSDKEVVERINRTSLENGLILNCKSNNIIRLFPALNITGQEMTQALDKLESIINKVITGDNK